MTIYKKYAKVEYKPFCQHHVFGQKKKLLIFALRKHQEQCNQLRQPSRDATVVKLRCGQIIINVKKISV